MVEKNEKKKQDNVEEFKASLKNLLKALDCKEGTEREIRDAQIKASASLAKFFKNLVAEKSEEFKTEVVSKAESLFNSAFGFTKELVEDLVEKAEDVFDSVDYKKEEEDRLRNAKEAEGKKSDEELENIKSITVTTSFNNLSKAGFCNRYATIIIGDIAKDMFDKPLGSPQCEALYKNTEIYFYCDDKEEGLRITKRLAAAMLDMANK